MLKFMLWREEKLCFMIDKMHVRFVIYFVHNRDKKEIQNGSNQLKEDLRAILMLLSPSFLIEFK